MQRHLTQKLSTVFFRQLRAPPVPKTFVMAAAATNMYTIFPLNAEHRHFHLLEHHDTFWRRLARYPGVVTTTAPVTGMFCASALAEYPGSRRHIQYQIIQIRHASPCKISASAPYWPLGRAILPRYRQSPVIADRVGRRAVRHNRRHMRTVWRCRALICAATVGILRTQNIGIENPRDLCTFTANASSPAPSSTIPVLSRSHLATMFSRH